MARTNRGRPFVPISTCGPGPFGTYDSRQVLPETASRVAASTAAISAGWRGLSLFKMSRGEGLMNCDGAAGDVVIAYAIGTKSQADFIAPIVASRFVER